MVQQTADIETEREAERQREHRRGEKEKQGLLGWMFFL